jgi:hypothetical protein
MLVSELIEQLGVAARAPARANADHVGICEAIEVGDGVWQKGTQITVSDNITKLGQTLADIGWDELRGEAGRGKPVWLVLLP